MRFYFPSNFFALHRPQPTFRRQNKIGSLDGITLQVQVVIKTFFWNFLIWNKSSIINNMTTKLGFHLVVQRSGWWVDDTLTMTMVVFGSRLWVNPDDTMTMTMVVFGSGLWVNPDDTLTMTMVVFGELQKNVFIQSRTLLTTHPCSSRCINTIPGGIQWKNLSLFSFSPHMHYGTWSPGKPWHWFPREN